MNIKTEYENQTNKKEQITKMKTLTLSSPSNKQQKQNKEPLTGLLPELPVVFDRNMPLPLKLEGGVDSELLAGRLPEGPCPSSATGIPLSLEVFVAAATAEFKDLGRGRGVSNY